MFKGSIVALVTPMHQDGTIDQQALHLLIEWHIESHTDALVIAGTTGEFATLELQEYLELLTSVVKQVNHRIPVIAGSGTNSTLTTIKISEKAKQTGVDACLIVTPYYNKPTQNGLYQHFKTISEQIDIPMILYNVPTRTACDMLPETVERLSLLKNIIGIKEATGQLTRAQEIIKRCSPSFKIYSGDDSTALDLLLHGAHGVISVTANIAPKKMHELCKAALNNQTDQAKKINDELMLLHKNLFLESNPIPAKWALYRMGKIQLGIRLPLLPLDPKFHQALEKAMHQAGVQ